MLLSFSGPIVVAARGTVFDATGSDCVSDAVADTTFLEAVKAGQLAGCGEGGYARIDRLARLLSAAARAGCASFAYHGFWGVFPEPPSSSGGKRANTAQRYALKSLTTRELVETTCTVGPPASELSLRPSRLWLLRRIREAALSARKPHAASLTCT